MPLNSKDLLYRLLQDRQFFVQETGYSSNSKAAQ